MMRATSSTAPSAALRLARRSVATSNGGKELASPGRAQV
jgi:hypothetical protein